MKNKKYHTTLTTQTFNTKIVTHKYMIAHIPGFLKENGEVKPNWLGPTFASQWNDTVVQVFSTCE